jgi:sugar phosphate isomerase/epimerase
MPLEDLALQLYSIRRETKVDPEAALRQVPGMGFNAVELAGTYDWSADKWKDLLRELGLKVVGAHISFDALLPATIAETLKFYGEIGCPRIIVPWMQVENTVEGWTAKAGELDAIAKSVHDEGFTFYYHNHDFEIREVPGADGLCGLEILMQNTDATKLAFEVDTYWVEKGGKNAADFILMYMERVGMVHAKELRRADGSDVPAGQGDIEFERILPEAIERGWPVVVEFEGENAVAAVTEAATHLRSL